MIGGPARVIPLSVPSVSGREWAYVKECLDTGWVSSAGKYVDRFEAEFAAYVGAGHAVACVNGTAALQVALRVVGVREGDEVLVPTLTFIATVNAVSYLSAKPVFLDCDEYYNLDVDKLSEFLETNTEVREGRCYNAMTGRRLAAIVPTHIFGNAVRLNDLIEICRPRGIRIVEDAAESVGTVYNDGSHAGTLGDMGCYSFNGNKIITTGGGGMIVTGDEELAAQARYLTTQAKDDDIRYIHNSIGYNFRLTNIQAAIGVAQLEQLPKYLGIKRRNFEQYRQAIAGIDGLRLAETPGYARNNHWMYALQIGEGAYTFDREGLMAHLAANGIQTRPVWQLNHLQKPYRECQNWGITRALRLWAITLNLPCSVSLTADDVEYVVSMLRHG